MQSAISKFCGRTTKLSPRPTRMLGSGFLLLCLLASGCDAVLPARQVPVFRSECVVREDLLLPQPVEDRDTVTNGDLLHEADSNKERLKQCNADKASVLDLINRQKGTPQ